MMISNIIYMQSL